MERLLRVAMEPFTRVVGLYVTRKRVRGQQLLPGLLLLLLIASVPIKLLLQEMLTLPDIMLDGMILLALAGIVSLHLFSRKKRPAAASSEPIVLFQEGKFVLDNVAKARLSPDEICAQMRAAGFAWLTEIKWIMLEPDGTLDFIPLVAEGRGGRGDWQEAEID